MADEKDELLLVLRPFAEIGKRLEWSGLDDDDPTLNDHVMEAPADDIAAGAFYCLMIFHFREAARLYDRLVGGAR